MLRRTSTKNGDHAALLTFNKECSIVLKVFGETFSGMSHHVKAAFHVQIVGSMNFDFEDKINVRYLSGITMGVIGLESFIERYPTAFRSVNLAEMAAEYRKKHPDMKGNPVIAMDFYNCLRFWNRNLEWVHGGQWDEHRKMLKDFLSAFERIGVEVVFFFSGLRSINKRKEWLADYIEEVLNSNLVFRQVEASEYLQLDFERNPAALPGAIPVALKYICHATVYRCVEGECIRTIASFASKNHCMAILGQSSDYLIYPTVAYVSMKHLDLDTMKTKVYCREALCRELGLHEWMLPLFACMVGKNMNSRRKLDEFHSSICNKIYMRRFRRIEWVIRSVAKYINSYALGSLDDVKRRLPELFDTRGIQKAYSLDELQKGIDSYSLTSTKDTGYIYPGTEITTQKYDNVYDVILRKVKNGELAPLILNVICEGRETKFPCLENANFADSLPPYVLVYRPLRQRKYGLVFALKEKYFDKSMLVPHTGALLPTLNTVDEWWINPLNPEEIDENVVLPLPVTLPDGISNETVLYDIIMENAEGLLEKKWALFMACLGLTMSASTFQELPHPYKSMCATLNYLIQQPDVKIKLWEIECFIYHAVHPKFLDSEWQLKLQLEPYNARAIHLATLFLKGSQEFYDLLMFSGNPIEMEYSMPWNFFRGRLFHYIYKGMCEDPYIVLCRDDPHVATFVQLRAAVLEGIDVRACFPE